MLLEQGLSALLQQLFLYSRLNTWLQWIGYRQLQDEMRNTSVLGFDAKQISYSHSLSMHNTDMAQIVETHPYGIERAGYLHTQYHD